MTWDDDGMFRSNGYNAERMLVRCLQNVVVTDFVTNSVTAVVTNVVIFVVTAVVADLVAVLVTAVVTNVVTFVLTAVVINSVTIDFYYVSHCISSYQRFNRNCLKCRHHYYSNHNN